MIVTVRTVRTAKSNGGTQMFVYYVLIAVLSLTLVMKKKQDVIYKHRFNISTAIAIVAGVAEVIFITYLIGSLFGELFYGVHSKWVWYNIAYKSKIELYFKIAFSALIVATYALLMVPGPTIMLCGLWDNSKKQCSTGIVVSAVSAISIAVTLQYAPTKTYGFIISIAASLQAVMGIVVSVAAISPAHTIISDEASSVISIRDGIKQGITTVSSKCIFCARFIVYLFKLNTESFHNAKKYIIIASQIIAIIVSAISLAQNRTVEFEQVVYRMQATVANISRIAVIFPTIAIVLLLCFVHNKNYIIVSS